MLRSRRNRERGYAERETAGESLWTEEFDERAIKRLDALWKRFESGVGSATSRALYAWRIAERLRSEGGWTVPERVTSGSLKGAFQLSHELALDMLEAMIGTFAQQLGDIDDEVNTVLREHRIGYRIVEHEVLDRGSDELHSSVIEPALGPLIDDALRKGLLAPHDKKLADWVSADRTTTGDAHRHSEATESDAWLTVHVVGALIVRLADSGRPRSPK